MQKGIKDLQSSALPLGYAAVPWIIFDGPRRNPPLCSRRERNSVVPGERDDVHRRHPGGNGGPDVAWRAVEHAEDLARRDEAGTAGSVADEGGVRHVTGYGFTARTGRSHLGRDVRSLEHLDERGAGLGSGTHRNARKSGIRALGADRNGGVENPEEGGGPRVFDPEEGQPFWAVHGDQSRPLRPPADVRSTDERQPGAGKVARIRSAGDARAAVTSSPGAIMKAVPPEGVAASGGKDEDARIA